MKLYLASGACSLAPQVVLQELVVPYKLARVGYKTKRTSNGQDFFAVDLRGAMDALQLNDGEVATEAWAILQCLADLKPDAKLGPQMAPSLHQQRTPGRDCPAVHPYTCRACDKTRLKFDPFAKCLRSLPNSKDNLLSQLCLIYR